MKTLVSEKELTEKSRVGYCKQFSMPEVGHSVEESVTGLKLRDFGRCRLARPACCRYSASAMERFPERPLMAGSRQRGHQLARREPAIQQWDGMPYLLKLDGYRDRRLVADSVEKGPFMLKYA